MKEKKYKIKYKRTNGEVFEVISEFDYPLFSEEGLEFVSVEEILEDSEA